jgi:uncharacterized protein (TIGR00251 family)
MREFKITDAKGGAAFTVRVVTRASKTEIAGVMDDGTLKIRLTAAPGEGKANKALIEFLAELLDVKKEQVEIIGGHSGREKLVSVIGVSPEQVDALIPETSADDDED